MRVSTPQSEAAAQPAVVDLQRQGWKILVAKKPKTCQTKFTVLERGYSDHVPPTRLVEYVEGLRDWLVCCGDSLHRQVEEG